MDRFFLNPLALLLSVLAGGIVLLYILKLRRVKVKVSSTLLWDRSVQDFKANAPWQRLRWNILMILQIIALLLLVLALSRPFIFGRALAGARSVIVIDTSASMLATDERPDRLGKALDAAAGVISDLSARDEAMVIAAGPVPRVLASFSRNKNELAAALKRARDYAGGRADLDAALRLVSSVTKGTRSRAVIFSDGAVPDIDPTIVTEDLKVSYFPVGKSSDNVGIVNAGARRNPFTGQYELFVALHNYYPREQKADMTISTNGDVLDVRSETLKAGQRAEIVLGDMPYIATPIKVELNVNDPLKEDNAAYIVMPERVRYKVALCAQRESLLLRKALESLPDVVLYSYSGGQLSGPSDPALAKKKVAVWVVEDDSPSQDDPAAGYLFINTSKHPFLPVIPGPVVQNDFNADPPVVLTVTNTDKGSELLRFVNLQDLRLKAMRRCQLQPWGRQVVEASVGPLIVEGRQAGQRTVYLAFDIYESDFPLRAAFPMFLANTLRYLGQGSAATTNLSAEAGTRVDLLAPPETTEAVITDPAGRKTDLPLGTRELTLNNTEKAGLYQVAYLGEGGKPLGQAVVPVSLVNEDESNIAPSKMIRIKGADEALAGGEIPAREIAGARQVRVNREFYTWLILFVLLVMGVEWYLYHTRAL